jgi:glutathione S-transferase
VARIRTIKPSFFSNEVLAQLSPWHRLCFIGLWGQADREGRLEDRPQRLKAAIFPYDNVDMDELLGGLAEKGFIVRYGADGVPAIQIDHFLKHQRPTRDEHVSLIPAPFLADSVGIPTVLPVVPRVGNREREIGNREWEEGAGADAAPLALPRAEDFVELWNTTTNPPIPRCRDLTNKRRRQIRARLTERPLAEWTVVIARIQQSRFCRGETSSRADPWVATIDWLIGTPDAAVKVLEGAYDDRESIARSAGKTVGNAAALARFAARRVKSP